MCPKLDATFPLKRSDCNENLGLGKQTLRCIFDEKTLMQSRSPLRYFPATFCRESKLFIPPLTFDVLLYLVKTYFLLNKSISWAKKTHYAQRDLNKKSGAMH